MQYVLIILILLFLVWPLIKGPVTRWFRTFMAHRTEDMMRRMMGMPSRKEERRRRKKEEKERRKSNFSAGGPHGARRHRVNPAAMMREVAVDVEYTEIKEFESRTSIDETEGTTKIICEEQISDAEFIEIKSHG